MITERNKRIKKSIIRHKVDVCECSLLLGCNRKQFNKMINEGKLTILQILRLAYLVGWKDEEIIDLFF